MTTSLPSTSLNEASLAGASLNRASLNEVLDKLEDEGLISAEPGVPFDEGAILAAFSEWAEDSGRPLYPHQEDSLVELLDGNHVIAQTPTGSGKSMIALAAHFISLARGGRSYYSAPLKALVSEKFFDLVDVFGAHNVGLITGDVALNTGAPIICCTAEILANQSLREGAALDADTVVMDEFHFFADPQRGWAWQVPLLELTSPQFVLLSATLGDTVKLSRDIEAKTGRDVAVIKNAERPVPLEFEYLVDPLAEVVERLVREGRAPIYIVHFTQADAVKSAADLSRTVALPENSKQMIRDELATVELGRGFGKTLRELLLKGVGVHHAGMLPRYRRLVERLTRKGALSIVCGTDTLGVGINVPIRTVIFTSLVKYDGRRSRILSAREFHQIAGRAGRPGFDDEGSVRVIASEDEIETAKRKARMTAAEEAGDAAKKRKLAKRAAKSRSPRQEGKISWTRSTFDRLVGAEPEQLVPRFRTSHSMFLNVLSGAGDAEQRLINLAAEAFAAADIGGSSGAGNAASADSSNRYFRELGDIYRSLRQAGLVERVRSRSGEGASTIQVTGNLPDEFALNQPLTPFALAALDLLDPDSLTFSLDILSVIEAVMENPNPVLHAQQRKARDVAFAAMREEGIEYEERRDRIETVTWPQPLAEVLMPAFDVFAVTNPWVRGQEPTPKKILREMVEEGSNFTQFISRYDLTISEGSLLRYLSDTYRALRQVLPDSYRTPEIDDIIDWLQKLLGSVDVSLVAEWEDLAAGGDGTGGAMAARSGADAIDPGSIDPETADLEQAFGADANGKVQFSMNRHAMIRAIRNDVFARIELMSRDDCEGLAVKERADRVHVEDSTDTPSTSPAATTSSDFTDVRTWERALDRYWAEHDWMAIDQDARKSELFSVETQPDIAQLMLATGVDHEDDLPTTAARDLDWWLVRQIILDPKDEGDWRLVLLVDRASTIQTNEPIMRTVALTVD